MIADFLRRCNDISFCATQRRHLSLHRARVDVVRFVPYVRSYEAIAHHLYSGSNTVRGNFLHDLHRTCGRTQDKLARAAQRTNRFHPQTRRPVLRLAVGRLGSHADRRDLSDERRRRLVEPPVSRQAIFSFDGVHRLAPRMGGKFVRRHGGRAHRDRRRWIAMERRRKYSRAEPPRLVRTLRRGFHIDLRLRQNSRPGVPRSNSPTTCMSFTLPKASTSI